MTSTTDRIEKSAVLRASLPRVWAAISDARQFGAWFGVALDGPFETGTRLHGRIVGTLERRANAFAANEQGWTIQLTLIAKYLALDPKA